MSDIEAVVRRGNDRFNSRDREGMLADMADDIVTRTPGGQVARGKAASLATNTLWWEACSDAHVESVALAVNGDTALEFGRFTGTHDGVLRTPMGDIPATGKQIRGDYASRWRFRGEQVVEAELLFDRMQLAEQLGIAPAPEAAGASA